MKKSLFTIDSFDAIFEGYTQGQHWNGWACPWFTKKVADEIMHHSNKVNGEDYQMRYDAETDTYVYGVGEETECFKGINFDGKQLYPIGTMSWIWDDLADYQSEQSKKLMAYLQDEYFWLDCERLHDVYYGICQEINGYMTDEQVKIFADGFMAAYGRNKE